MRRLLPVALLLMTWTIPQDCFPTVVTTFWSHWVSGGLHSDIAGSVYPEDPQESLFEPEPEVGAVVLWRDPVARDANGDPLSDICQPKVVTVDGWNCNQCP